MAYLDSNEPFQRIDEDVWYGLGIGAGVGLAAGGGTILAARFAHNRIPKKAEKRREELNDERLTLQNKLQKTTANRYNPIEYIQSRFGGPLGEIEAHASLLRRTEDKRRKYQDKINQIQEEINHKWSQDAVKALQSKSFYNRHMHGWGRKAGIAGLATGIGAGVGALTGWLVSESDKQKKKS